MDKVTIDLKPRDVTGKSVKRLRDEGLVPAVIHDHGKDSVVVMGQYIDLVKAYRQAGKHHPVSLTAGRKHYMALIKGVDFDPKKHTLRHVVFNAVNANEQVVAEIPVRIKYAEGNDATPAERAGLVVLNQLDLVEVEALPDELPDVIEFDGEKLVEVGDHVAVSDLIVPPSVVIKTDLAHPIATVFEPSALQAANDAAGGTADEAEEAAETTEEAEAGAENVENGEAAAAPKEQEKKE